MLAGIVSHPCKEISLTELRSRCCEAWTCILVDDYVMQMISFLVPYMTLLEVFVLP